MYIAFIDINDLYCLLDKYNVQRGTYSLKLSNQIKDEYNFNFDQTSKLIHINYFTQYISYTSLIQIINLIKINTNIDNYNNINNLLKHISKTFPDVFSHFYKL